MDSLGPFVGYQVPYLPTTTTFFSRVPPSIQWVGYHSGFLGISEKYGGLSVLFILFISYSVQTIIDKGLMVVVLQKFPKSNTPYIFLTFL